LVPASGLSFMRRPIAVPASRRPMRFDRSFGFVRRAAARPAPYGGGSAWSRNSPSLWPAKRNAPRAPRRIRRETECDPSMIRQMTSRPVKRWFADLFQPEIRKAARKKGRYPGAGAGQALAKSIGHPGEKATTAHGLILVVVVEPRAQDRTPVPDFSPPTSTRCRQWLYPSWSSLIRCSVRLALASALPLS
jgi:hypothetical protein